MAKKKAAKGPESATEELSDEQLQATQEAEQAAALQEEHAERIRAAEANVAQAQADLDTAKAEHEEAKQAAIEATETQEQRDARVLAEDPDEDQIKTSVGLYSGDAVSYHVVEEGGAKERRLLIHGKNYEHVGEDRWGRWLYRPMP